MLDELCLWANAAADKWHRRRLAQCEESVRPDDSDNYDGLSG